MPTAEAKAIASELHAKAIDIVNAMDACESGHDRIRVLAAALLNQRQTAFGAAAHIIRQGCGFAPPHGKCDHESIAVAIEGFSAGGMEGMIAALDRLKASNVAAFDEKGGG
jgi:hypothetical protein